jgi:hypothetical protein
MDFMQRLFALLLFVTTSLAAAGAQDSRPVDVARLGPQIGTRVPDFTAIDQEGRQQTLQSIMGPGGAMLVFFRSADW